MSRIDAVVTILSDCCDIVVLGWVKKQRGGAAAVDIYWRMAALEEACEDWGSCAKQW